MTNSLLHLEGIAKSYPEADSNKQTLVIEKVNFSLNAGESMCLTGPSGSGKSTLLQIIGLLDRPTEGQLLFNGEDAEKWKRSARERFRAEQLGFVFQRHLLLPEFTLLENVALPLARTQGWTKAVYEKSEHWLEKMGLMERRKAYPKQLSGGEMQRGAICRALIHDPKIVLMDEPTGNLDPAIGQKVMEDVFNWLGEMKVASILVTHNLELTKLNDKHYRIQEHLLEMV